MPAAFASKREFLRAVRERPEFWLGAAPQQAHLTAISAALEFAWTWRYFAEPQYAEVSISPHQYHIRCRTGPMREEKARSVNWDDSDDLLLALLQIGQSEPGLGAIGPWAGSFTVPRHHRDLVGAPLYLAARGALALRTGRGLWCQAYEDGWPVAPPFLVPDSGTLGLMVAASLSARWFPGLPFTAGGVESLVADYPAELRPPVTIQWHEEDDLVPACRADPGCVLQPENIQSWL